MATAGHHGFVTELLVRRLAGPDRPTKIVGCGPPAMLADAREDRPPARCLLRCLARKPHGVRFRCVLQLRRADSSGRWFVRPSPGVRRRAGRFRRQGRLGAARPLRPGRGGETEITEISTGGGGLLTAELVSALGSDRGAGRPVHNLRGPRPRRAVRARSFRPRTSCGYRARRRGAGRRVRG